MILFTLKGTGAQSGKKYPKNALDGCSAGFRRLDSQNFSRRGATFGLLAERYVTAPAKNSLACPLLVYCAEHRRANAPVVRSRRRSAGGSAYIYSEFYLTFLCFSYILNNRSNIYNYISRTFRLTSLVNKLLCNNGFKQYLRCSVFPSAVSTAFCFLYMCCILLSQIL